MISGPSQATQNNPVVDEDGGRVAVKASSRNWALLTVIIGSVMSLVLFFTMQSWEQRHLKSKFIDTTIGYDLIFKDKLHKYIQELETVKHFFSSIGYVSAIKFKAFTVHFASDPAIQAIEWVPRITDTNRNKFELAIRSQGYKKYSINDGVTNGLLIPAKKRHYYYPVAYINPLQGNKIANGYDLGVSPSRRNALEKARDTGEAIVTEPIRLIQAKDKKRHGFLLFLPYYGHHSEQTMPSTKKQRRKKLKGFFLGVFYADAIIEAALKTIKSHGLNIRFSDTTDPKNIRLLYSHRSRSYKLNNIVKHDHTLKRYSKIHFAGRIWQIQYTPVKKFYDTNSNWYSEFILASGLIFTLFISIIMNIIYRRSIELEKWNKLKTQQLTNIQTAQNTLLDAMGDALIIIDHKGRVEAFNQAAEKMFGYTSAEIIGGSINKLMPEDLARDHDRYIHTGIIKNQTVKINNSRNIEGIRKDGVHFPIALTVKSMDIGGKPKFTGVLRDITQRVHREKELIQAKEQAEIAAQAKSDFMATMSHEIRTPMNGILGMTQILEETALNTEQQEQLAIIDSSAKALLSIINDILDFSKIEAGKLDIIPEIFNIKHIVQSTLNLLKSDATEKKLSLNLVIDDQCPVYFLADAGRIRQILMNLIGNAIKFTPKGSITLQIQCLEKNNSQARLRFEVIDTGIGISKEAQVSLFDSFTQVDNSMQRNFGGTGLGLAISKQLITLMHGEIGVESKAEQGSTFWFELELPLADGETKNTVSSTTNKLAIDANILLVEDNIVNEKIMCAMLGKLNIRYEHAENGEQAVKKWADGHFDLILMDCQMPIMDGFEATRLIRKNEGQHKIPIIALTANVLDTDKQHCIEVGMNDHVAKPIVFETLESMLQHWLSKKSNQVA